MYFLLLLSLFTTGSIAQEFGFGCLGLVGGYAGYGFYRFDAQGLNAYVKDYNFQKADSLSQPYKNFGVLTGYRFGLNIYRQSFSGIIVTLKGFYESLEEKSDATISNVGSKSFSSLVLKSNNFGLGIDIGIKLTRIINLKVIDASILFNGLKLTRRVSYPGGISSVDEYKPLDSEISYNLGSGFIFHIIENYISLEGTAGYSFRSQNTVQRLNKTYFTFEDNTPVTGVIKKGGFTGAVQMNLGFPL